MGIDLFFGLNLGHHFFDSLYNRSLFPFFIVIIGCIQPFFLLFHLYCFESNFRFFFFISFYYIPFTPSISYFF